MARILLCFSSHLFIDNHFRLVCYYEGLIKELIENGNDVMVYNGAEFLMKSWNSENIESSYIDKNELKDRIFEFNPNLVISFNNVKPSFLDSLVECPIVIWEADSFTYFNDKDGIKYNPNRYSYFCLSSNTREQLISTGVADSNIYMINSGTAVQAKKLDYEYNISFIGSNFRGPSGLKSLLLSDDSDKVRSAIKKIANDFYLDSESYLIGQGLESILEYIKPSEFGMIKSAQNRILTLNLMEDLGLSLFGGKDWLDVSDFTPYLALSYKRKDVYSLAHNQGIYNKSKVCLSISHAQAIDGFPWRIMDIMASNGCLLSSYNPGLVNFTKGYVDIPMYKSPAEAYNLAKKLIADVEYRNDIIVGSQKCIEDKGRWSHRFLEIESAIGIDLINVGSGSLNILSREDFLSRGTVIFNQSIMLLASAVPRRFWSSIYKMMMLIGVNVDYHMIKNMMEKK
ncbi:hypothetical protein VST7929_02658 [Vibrio stylophorae]|uniref:Spore protein YkvP/CgeB glycosyl transferase-like domain-containing protein n=1 Tax=Vibrio stylophorae TaxID=659351 RepID=A0ABM8ZWJ0_9VIBR|nr:hypothetical protein [Vibrio stylophorae]CAH0534708.1 hypothetical protein VST7929_02658 [Vibrio stylophorae]